MSLLKSLCSAFLMYSRIPFPKVQWKEENRRFSLCFFPLIGAVIGICLLLWYRICEMLEVGNLFFSVGCTLIPIAVTGGIHLDGFCDVNDALASCAPREKMLEIMKDPNTGAFALIRLSVYLLIQTAVFTELRNFNLLLICSLCFIQSRAWSGLAAVTFPNAKGHGSLQNFSEPAHKTITIITEIIWLTFSALTMIIICPIAGTAMTVCGVILFIYYYYFSKRKFGGITGDLAGWFLQVAELSALTAAAIANLIK